MEDRRSGDDDRRAGGDDARDVVAIDPAVGENTAILALLIMLMGALMEVMRDFAHAVGGERNDLTIKARRRLLDCLHKHDADGAAAAIGEHLASLHQRYRERDRPRRPAKTMN